MSSRIARNTQLIIQNETNITKTIDPLAGSYYIENLTNALIVHSGKLIDEILDMGGMTKAIEKGYPNRLIEESAIMKQSKIDSGSEIIVGVNKYQNENEKDFPKRASLCEQSVFYFTLFLAILFAPLTFLFICDALIRRQGNPYRSGKNVDLKRLLKKSK